MRATLLTEPCIGEACIRVNCIGGLSVSRGTWKVPYPIYIIFRLLLDMYYPNVREGRHM